MRKTKPKRGKQCQSQTLNIISRWMQSKAKSHRSNLSLFQQLAIRFRGIPFFFHLFHTLSTPKFMHGCRCRSEICLEKTCIANSFAVACTPMESDAIIQPKMTQKNMAQSIVWCDQIFGDFMSIFCCHSRIFLFNAVMSTLSPRHVKSKRNNECSSPPTYRQLVIDNYSPVRAHGRYYIHFNESELRWNCFWNDQPFKTIWNKQKSPDDRPNESNNQQTTTSHNTRSATPREWATCAFVWLKTPANKRRTKNKLYNYINANIFWLNTILGKMWCDFCRLLVAHSLVDVRCRFERVSCLIFAVSFSRVLFVPLSPFVLPLSFGLSCCCMIDWLFI